MYVYARVDGCPFALLVWRHCCTGHWLDSSGTPSIAREKAVLDELRALQKKRDELVVRLEQAQARMDLAMVADIKYGSLAETDEQIAYKQSQVRCCCCHGKTGVYVAAITTRECVAVAVYTHTLLCACRASALSSAFALNTPSPVTGPAAQHAA